MNPDRATEHYDLAIVGAGSGGIGAAIAAARLGLSVALIEKADVLGGNAVRGGVHIWEPGTGGSGIPFDIYQRLIHVPRAAGIYSIGRHSCWLSDGQPQFPGGENLIDPARKYIHTLRSHGAGAMKESEAFCREHWHGVVFEPHEYCRVVEKILLDTGACAILKNTGLKRARAEGGQVVGLELDDGRIVEADAYIDGTADGFLALACGCASRIGQDAQALFDEPDAPALPTDRVNAITLIYRITPSDEPSAEESSVGAGPGCWWQERFPPVSATQYPCGDFNMNMLPTMDGREFLRVGYPAALEECRRRVRAHWHDLQTRHPEFRRFRLSWIAPALGVRESRRIVGEYVLTQHDLLAGLRGQEHPDIVTVVDHGMDTHGESAGYRDLREPYGVPYRCLIPKGFKNLLVACRGASFSSIAASSCRLSRTIMQLGQAAGTAAALARKMRVALPDIPPEALREALVQQHVQLQWPMPQALIHRLCGKEMSPRVAVSTHLKKPAPARSA